MSAEDKKTGGRRAGLNQGELEGDPIGIIQEAARVGNAGVTRGADYCKDLIRTINEAADMVVTARAYSWTRANSKQGTSEADLRRLKRFENEALRRRRQCDTWRQVLEYRLSVAISRGDAKFVREIAEYLDAEKRAKDAGPVAPDIFAAIEFMKFCKGSKTLRRSYLKRWNQRLEPHARKWVAALSQRPEFFPSSEEIHEFLNQTLPESDMPSAKTVQRIAKRIGLKKTHSVSE